MIKTIILLLFFIPVLTIAQNNDTIFYKDGHKLGCTITKIENNIIYCVRIFNDNPYYGSYNLNDIEKYNLGTGSKINPDVKNNPNITVEEQTKKDTFLIKQDTNLTLQINNINKRIDGIVSNNRMSGQYFKNAGWGLIAGSLCNFVGTGLVLLGSYFDIKETFSNSKVNSATGFYVAGLLFSTAGVVISIAVPINFINAGKAQLRNK